MIKEYKPVVTIILIVINVAVFLLETAAGGSENVEIAIRFGAQYTPYILQDGQWYRLFTSMFVHFGINHIASNMLALMALGYHAEFYFGKIRYLIIYILSGICGSVLSMVMELYSLQYAVSAGASGAICGLIGTLLIFAFDPATKKQFPLRRVIAGIVLILIPTGENINYSAHIGGMIGGFLVAYTIYYFMKKNGTFIEKIYSPEELYQMNEERPGMGNSVEDYYNAARTFNGNHNPYEDNDPYNLNK